MADNVRIVSGSYGQWVGFSVQEFISFCIIYNGSLCVVVFATFFFFHERMIGVRWYLFCTLVLLLFDHTWEKIDMVDQLG